jgi:hypothetical protein
VVQNDEYILSEIKSKCFPSCFHVKAALFYRNNFTFVFINYSEGCRKFPTKTGVRLLKVAVLYGSNVSVGLCRIVENFASPVCLQVLKIDSYCL